MNILVLLGRHSLRTVTLVALSGLMSGLTGAGLLVVINNALASSTDNIQLLALGFFGLAILRIGSGVYSMLMLSAFSQEIILKLLDDVTKKLLQSPLRLLEEKGTHRILAILTDGVSSISWAIQALPSIIMNVAILCGCAVYLAWLSIPAFIGMLSVISVGLLIHRRLLNKAFRVSKMAMEQRDVVHQAFSGLTGGIKELLLSKSRREEFLRHDVGETAAVWRDLCLKARMQHSFGDTSTQVLLYGLIGVVIFLFPRAVDLRPQAATAYVFTLLYMLNPIWAILGTIPNISQGQAALSRFQELDLCLTNQFSKGSSCPAIASKSAAVELREIGFSYDTNGKSEHGFTLGPLSFQIGPGELVFVIGGNGSGKSTFIKLLTGLYRPNAGEIWLNEKRVDEDEIEDYRENFSAVFSDFYVFNRLVGMRADDLDGVARKFLRVLQLDAKVEIKNGVFSSTSLSQGQRKRLALLTAYLEDRPVYVFDEWAADQDPQYKEIFYTKILPELKSRGKAIVVVTHDDRYFHVGDRVIKLQDGKIVSAYLPANVPANPFAYGG